MATAKVTWALHTLSNVRLIFDSNGRWRQIPEHPRYVRRRLVGDGRRVGVTVSHNWTTSQRTTTQRLRDGDRCTSSSSTQRVHKHVCSSEGGRDFLRRSGLSGRIVFVS